MKTLIFLLTVFFFADANTCQDTVKALNDSIWNMERQILTDSIYISILSDHYRNHEKTIDSQKTNVDIRVKTKMNKEMYMERMVRNIFQGLSGIIMMILMWIGKDTIISIIKTVFQKLLKKKR